jgi:NADH dehydrogenase [ubiquinone] 1 alpha subcomplex assembly factor 3
MFFSFLFFLFFSLQAVQWRNVKTPADITLESLMLFVLANPKVDILILGTGTRTEFISPSLRAELRARGIAVEQMASDKALATFNILAEEARNVGCALLTMTHSGWRD